jgi:hypothetical protein
VSAGWLLLAIGIAAAAVALAMAWPRRDRHRDLGTVSDHWISEQRFGHREQSQR